MTMRVPSENIADYRKGKLSDMSMVRTMRDYRYMIARLRYRPYLPEWQPKHGESEQDARRRHSNAVDRFLEDWRVNGW